MAPKLSHKSWGFASQCYWASSWTRVHTMVHFESGMLCSSRANYSFSNTHLAMWLEQNVIKHDGSKEHANGCVTVEISDLFSLLLILQDLCFIVCRYIKCKGRRRIWIAAWRKLSYYTNLQERPTTCIQPHTSLHPVSSSSPSVLHISSWRKWVNQAPPWLTLVFCS